MNRRCDTLVSFYSAAVVGSIVVMFVFMFLAICLERMDMGQSWDRDVSGETR